MRIRNHAMAIVLASAVAAVPALAQGPDRVQQQVHQGPYNQSMKTKEVQSRKQVTGSDLMTEQERLEHQQKVRSMKTEQEREAYRSAHHEEMKQRAREQGVELSDEVPGKRNGQGKGKGQGK